MQWVSKRELHSGTTPLLCTTQSQGQGQQSYTDSPRVKDKPRGCRQSKSIAHKAIKFTKGSTIRGSNTSCFHLLTDVHTNARTCVQMYANNIPTRVCAYKCTYKIKADSQRNHMTQNTEPGNTQSCVILVTPHRLVIL